MTRTATTATRDVACLLQHATDTPPGLLAEWLGTHGIPFRVVRPDRGEPVPGDPRAFRWLAILGSEHSATGTEPEWIGDELELTRRAIEADVPVLGICFGGQVLARALGGAIGPAPAPSIGWHLVEPVGSSPVDAGPWLHFNYEAFSVPDQATMLAGSPAGPAAFRAGPHLAVQFHLEATVEIVDAWMRWDAERLARLGLDPVELLAASPERRAHARESAFALLDAWASGW